MKIPLFFVSVQHALRGIGVVLRSERHFRFQTLAGVVVLGLAFGLPLEVWQRVTLVLLVVMVLVLEMINSVVERLADVLKPRVHPSVRDMKDMMAGTVLLAAFTALVVGIMILYPYLVQAL